jgi:hypothetical protein
MLDFSRLPTTNTLDARFLETEIYKAITELTSEKAPDPDGFTGLFYKSCWGIVKSDIFAAFQCLYNQVTSPLPKLNGAMITLIPKKEAAKLPWYTPLQG